MSNETQETQAVDNSTTELFNTEFFGMAKWFNNRNGYGYITIVGKEGTPLLGQDIFVHHTELCVSGKEMYKYLVKGEYVNFYLKPVENSAHQYAASQITGLFKNPLMCETKSEERALRQVHSSNSLNREDTSGAAAAPVKRKRAYIRGPGPRDGIRKSRSDRDVSATIERTSS